MTSALSWQDIFDDKVNLVLVFPGQFHQEGCPVIRCLMTGYPQQYCSCDNNHHLNDDLWTGMLPGEYECRQWGWMLGSSEPDIASLYQSAVWNYRTCLWQPRSQYRILGKENFSL